MSVACTPGDLSNALPRPWVITVIVVVLISWREASEVVGAYVDAMALAALAMGASSAAAKYRNRGTS